MVLLHRPTSYLGSLVLVLVCSHGSSKCLTCLDGHCDTNGVCSNGCEAGFADKYCQLRCPTTCKYSRCKVEKTTGKVICTKGCEDGYCGVQCKTPCPDGCLRCDQHTGTNCSVCENTLYGDKCQHSCYDKCHGFSCDNTGICQDSCMEGWYGTNCSQACHLRYDRCDIKTGKCINCRRGFYGDSCENLCPSCLPAEEESRYTCTSGCLTCINVAKDNEDNGTKWISVDTELKRLNICVGIVLVITTISLSLTTLLMAKGVKLLKTLISKKQPADEFMCCEKISIQVTSTTEHFEQMPWKPVCKEEETLDASTIQKVQYNVTRDAACLHFEQRPLIHACKEEEHHLSPTDE